MGKQLQQAFHKRYDNGENPRKSIQHHEGKRNQSWWDVISFSSVQSLSPVQLFVTPWTSARQASLSITNSRMLSNHLILCHPLLLPPSIFPSIRVFSNELVLCIRWPKYGSFSFRINPSNEYSGLISFTIDWFHFLAVRESSQVSSPTPQFKSINSLALSFLYSPTLTSIPTLTIIALTRWTFVGNVSAF